MDKKIRNPLTNRWIKIGSKTYNDLIEKNIIPKGQIRRTKKFMPPVDYRVPASFKNYPIDYSSTPWGQLKPSKISQRRETLRNCGESCFLIPDKLAFPICNKTKPCTYNCKGIKAASSRAGQWKYQAVLKKSKELSNKFDCYKKK